MSDEYILRGENRVLKLRYTPDRRLEVDGAPEGLRELRILRRESGGLMVALWGDEVVSGVVSVRGDAFDLLLSGSEARSLKALSLKTAAIDAMEQAVAAAGGSDGPLSIASPIPGLIKSVKVKPGDAVEEGQTVVVLEAMKMENEIPTPRAGTVQSVDVQPGQTVGAGVLLVKIVKQ